MTALIEINEKKFYSIEMAVARVGYSRDYITRLARAEKIIATQIGRKWYIDVDSLKNYQQVMSFEQELKKRRLSEDRKRLLELKDARTKRVAKNRITAGSQLVAAVLTCFAVISGVGLGFFFESRVSGNVSEILQVASARIALMSEGLQQTDERLDLMLFNQAEDAALVPDFSTAVSQRSFVAPEGLLLLPVGSTATTTVPDYFSDPVVVVTGSDGGTQVVRANADGMPTGEALPFVEVPINVNSP